MYFGGIPETEFYIVAFTGRVTDVQETEAGLESQSNPCTKHRILHIHGLVLVLYPGPVDKTKHKRIQRQAVPVFGRQHRELGGVNALFTETTQEFVPADLEEFVPEGMLTAEKAAGKSRSHRGLFSNREIVSSGYANTELVGPAFDRIV